MPSFKIRNQNSNLVIDDSYANLGLRQSGAVSSVTAFTPSSYYVDVSLPSDQGVIAFRCTAPCMIVSSTRSGANMVYRFVTATPVTVEYWHFDLSQYARLYNTPGKLIIRRPSDGRVAFDSRTPYMRVRQFLSWGQIPGSTDFSYAGLPAVVQVKRGWSINSALAGGGGTGSVQIVVWVSSWANTNGGTVTVKGQDYLNIADENLGTVYPSNNFSEQTMYMVIDVSNF